MSPQDEDVTQPVADMLAALDAQLVDGLIAADGEPELPADQARLYRLARESLLRLEQTWPRRTDGPAATFDLLTGAGRLGRFELKGELGRGGGGIVFRAIDTENDREVALKLPRLEALLDPALRDRFLDEAKIVTGLSHPALVPVLETGEVGAVCYIASEFAGETTLESWLESRVDPTPPRTAAALVAALAGGVEYLHTHHILHRDIKPSNILLSPLGRAIPDPELRTTGAPRLTDFGLAKLLDAASPDGSSMGGTGGLVLGTAEYMAPEQADARPTQLGRHTDVYALGAVLHEMIVGQPPFRGRNKFDTLRKVLHEPAPRLSSSRRDVPRDLEWICLKCLEKDPRRRYATAGALADDLHRWLSGTRPLARPTPWWRTIGRWATRRPRQAAALVATALMVPSVMISAFGLRLYQESSRSSAKHRLSLAWDARSQGVAHAERGDMLVGLLWLAKALTLAPAEAGDLAQLLRWDLAAWQARTPRLSAVLPHPADVWSTRFSQDGRVVLTLAHDYRGRVWKSEDGSALNTLPHPRMVFQAEFSHDGRTIRTACVDGHFRTWDIFSGQIVRQTSATGRAADPMADPVDATAEALWEFGLGRPPDGPVQDRGRIWLLRPSPDRKTVLTLSFGNRVRLWESETAKSIGDALPHAGMVHDAAWSRDGALIATAGSDNSVRFWDPTKRTEVGPSLPHATPVRSVAFDPQGDRIATGGLAEVALWSLDRRQRLIRLSHQNLVSHIGYSDDGHRLATVSGNRTVNLWRLPGRDPENIVHPLAGQPAGATHDDATVQPRGFAGITGLAFHPDGQTIISSGIDDSTRQWDSATGRSLGIGARHRGLIETLKVDASHQRVWTAGEDRVIRCWDLVNGRLLKELPSHRYTISALAVGPRSGRLASGSLTKDVVKIQGDGPGSGWDSAQSLTGVFDLAFSPDETHLVATGMDGLHHWDLDRGQYTHIPMPCSTFAVAFDPKGDRFVTGSAQGELHWWRLGDPRPTRIVAAHAHRVTAVAFSPDGRVLATTGWDRRLRLWHVPTAQPIGPGWELPDDGQSVAFRPDGRLLAAGCKGGQVVKVEVPSPVQHDRTSTMNAIRLATGLEWDEHDTVRPLDERTWCELRSAGSRHVETP